MKCIVYRSANKDFTYLYLRNGLSFDDLPHGLMHTFGQAEQVLELELSPARKLAREDVEAVITNLREQGYHLQLPPKDDPSGWLDLPENTG
jgi:uncharacterized protein YcgL (UPF0745 family)